VHRASAAIPRRQPATASETTGTFASAAGSGSSGRHGDAKRRRTGCAPNFHPAAPSPRDTTCGPPLGPPLLPQQTRSERPCVRTPRGWRHPAYDAKPLASLR
jgi:hypothetical protein